MRIFANREEILRKPLQVFIKMNCEKATQMEKTKACGLSKAGLVYYFPFKQKRSKNICCLAPIIFLYKDFQCVLCMVYLGVSPIEYKQAQKR